MRLRVGGLGPGGLFAGVLCLCLATSAPAVHRVAPTAVLRLTNDSFLTGQVVASADPATLRWRSPYFARPFEFPLSAVRTVTYPVTAARRKSERTFCFELAGDSVLYGDLLGLDGDELEVDAATVGRVHLQRDRVARIYPWKGANSVYLGPDGLERWKDSAVKSLWRDEGGQLFTDQAGAWLYGDFGIPAKAVIEFELSWKQKPDFLLALGVSDAESAVQPAFRFEVWDNDLVAIAESEADADAATVGQFGPGGGRLHVQVYLDQEQKRLLLFSRGGKSLAVLQVKSKKHGQPGRGVRLVNRRGDVLLEYLRISRWNGAEPVNVREDQSRVHRTDGTIVYGRLAAYDPQRKQFTVREGRAETQVKQDEIAEVFLLSTSVAPAKAGKLASSSDPTVGVEYQDGSRFGGKVTRIEDMHVCLTCPGIKEPLRLPLAAVRSLVGFTAAEKPGAPLPAGRPGRLEMEGVQMRGCLASGTEEAGASCLAWRPDLALDASPLRPGVSGRVVYRDPPPPAPPKNALGQVVVQRAPPPTGINKKVQDALRALEGSEPAPEAPRLLHLRTGDTIPCTVVGIDEKGLHIKTPLSDATLVPHEKIKAVALVPAKDPPALAKAKRQRLLTLPRMQKASPPTHLICSHNGDLLRGRILEMDDKSLRVEVRLETKEIPRDRVAQIIWLHPDELATPKTVAAATATNPLTRVQTLRAADSRLTFVARKLDNGTLTGENDILGPCRASLADVDELLIGTCIEQSAARLAYQRWKLHNAVEPKFVQANAGGAGGGLTGSESPLRGQPGYAFKLDLLDGQPFRLADHKGRFVVLDFWATWCGPCMQTMPLIDEVVRDFTGEGVELVAVNMEEQPEQIKSILERHKLKLTVALDRDGVVAARYAVTAIPQTVVIDREGKVSRLFVGGGKNTAEALRKALEELTRGKPAAGGTP
jgi:thiol-disulfide isomerase/thioredoxin